MSVRVQFLRETWAFLRTFTGRAGEFAIDTTNNRLVVQDGVTPGGFPTARADQVALAGRTPVADANYAALTSDVTVAYTALTAARTVTLPAASGYPAGRVLTVLDETGACSATNPITVATAGGDTVNGAASVTLATPYAVLGAMSNGAGRWVLVDQETTALQNLARLGIGTTADAQNPFAAKLNKALWTALTTAEGGTGDLRYTLNKQAPGNTLSLLFQSGFSGRAEIGLTGDDDLRLKVSADGGAWREALRVDRSTGGLDFAAVEASAPIAATVDLGALPALKVALTGTGTLTSFGTGPNRVRLLRFTDAATLTHTAASLVLPGGATLVTAAGDTALATSDAAGAWTVRDYVRASGRPVTGPAATDITDASASGRAVLTGTPAAGATALGLGAGNVPALASLTVSRYTPEIVFVDQGAATNQGRVAFIMYLGAFYLQRRNADNTYQNNVVTLSANGSSLDLSAAVSANNGLTVSGGITFNSPARLATYTVATIPAGVTGSLIYVSNARKSGEATGSGTGVVAYSSNGSWRRLSDDSPVAA